MTAQPFTIDCIAYILLNIFSKAVQNACDTYEDEHLAPSVAVGVAYKNNVESSMESVFSDAEVEMLENKISIKNSKEYCNRLKKKL